MKSDKQLMELAAKAAGIAVHWDSLEEDDWTAFFVRVSAGPLEGRSWYPLGDWLDAMQLAIMFKMNVRQLKDSVAVRPAGTKIFVLEEIGVESERDKDTMRAITKAAAAIGDLE